MSILWRLILFVVALCGFALPQLAFATNIGLSQTCEQVATEASRRTGVPVSVLKAISLTETGRKLEGRFVPWPWTVNMEGEGHWFDTLDEARAYVFKEFKRGARSFDVGCFQINYKWHNEAFSSIDEMFDPLSNALYAAKFLGELYQEMGNWNAAAGAYHSRTKENADKYSARFAELRKRYAGEDGNTPMLAQAQGGYGDIPEIPDIVAVANGAVEVAPPRVNTYPLLQRAEGAQAPPLGGASGASLFASALQKVEVN